MHCVLRAHSPPAAIQNHRSLGVVRPFAAYRTMVQGREAPVVGNFPRSEELLMAEFLSPTMAVVKVRLRLFNNIMEDHLNLMKHEGRWMIYAKHFTRVGSA
jgi:hypothetical protein